MLWPSGLVHWTQVLVLPECSNVRIPAWPVTALVSLSKTLNHNCFVLRMGRKAVGPVCCVIHVHVKEPRTLIVKEKGLAPVFLDSCLEHPAGWICACYKSYHYHHYYYYYYSKKRSATIGLDNSVSRALVWRFRDHCAGGCP